jgi:hypothetical protein
VDKESKSIFQQRKSSKSLLSLLDRYFRVARTCGTDTLYALIHSRPDFISNASGLSVHVSTSTAANTGGDIVEASINSQQQP